jgi:predicted permease
VLTVVAVATLALGIGANTAIFSVINGALLKPLPFQDPDRLAWLSDRHPRFGGSGVDQSIPNLEDLRAEATRMSSSAMYRTLGANLATGDQATRVSVLVTSSEMLRVLGVNPVMGRDLAPEDDLADAAPVALLSYGLWRSDFGADPGVVGTDAHVDARSVRIVGVLPESFTFPGEPQLVMPLRHVGAEPSRGSRGYHAVARLAPGATAEELRTELQGIFERLVEEYPEVNQDWYTWAEPLSDYALGRNRQTFFLLGGGVLLVLLIACANVANLLLVRAETRQRELAVRYSLGARGSNLVSLFLGEALLLSLLGGALGVASARWSVRLLVALFGDSLPRAQTITVDGTVLLFGVGVTLLVGLLVGVAPVLRARRMDLYGALKEGGRGMSGRESHLGRFLVMAEIALAVVVVSGAGLLANSMWRLQHLELGVTDAQRVMTFTMSLPPTAYPDAASIGRFADDFTRINGAIPGVQAVALVNRLPLLGGDNATIRVVGDESRQADFTSVRQITPGYFEATGVPLLAGRWLDDADFREGTSSVIINQTLARMLFPGEDPLGQRIGRRADGEGMVVVGVCADIPGGRADAPAPPAFYQPMASLLRGLENWTRGPNDYVEMSALIRTAGDPRPLTPAFREAVASIDPQLPLNRVRTLQDLAVARLGTRRLAMSLFGCFALLALALGAVGIYGVMSFSVAQRAREMSMRMALGASRGSVLRMVMVQSARLAAPGLVVGVGAAMASARLLENLLFQVSPLDPWTYLSVASVLAAVAMLATWAPALRATRADPMAGMRSD